MSFSFGGSFRAPAEPPGKYHRPFQQSDLVKSIVARKGSLAGTLMLLIVACQLTFCQAVCGEDMNKGSTSQSSRKAAIRAIPMSKLNQPTQEKIKGVVGNASIYRRLPVTTIETDPDMFIYLVRYPEIVVNIWQIMGATKMAAKRKGAYLISTDDGVGTKGTVDLVYGSPKLHVFYCEGQYEGPLLLRPVKARCVLLLQTEYFAGRDGKPRAQNRLDIFLKIDNMAANVIAKTVHPLIGSTADHNFVESLKFLENLHKTTIENGPGVQRLGQRLNNVTPGVRRRFQQLAGLVYVRSNPIGQPQQHGNRKFGFQEPGNRSVPQDLASGRLANQKSSAMNGQEARKNVSGVRRTISSPAKRIPGSGSTTRSAQDPSQSVLIRPKR